MTMLGVGALVANKLRRLVRSYDSPRDFDLRDVGRCCDYSLSVIAGWGHELSRYLGKPFEWTGLRVLEIGPGPDLGTGFIMLSRGCASYTALDTRCLLEPQGLHVVRTLVERLGNPAGLDEELNRLERGLADPAGLADGRGRLRYIVDPERTFAGLDDSSVDVVVSQAVLEHVDDLAGWLGVLGRILAPGVVWISHVDLQTHTRYLRWRDPLNIYRFGERLYGALRFDGLPSRRRPDEYRRIFQQAGWTDVQAWPAARLDQAYTQRLISQLAKPFRQADSHMDWLAMVLCARRP